MTGAKIEMSFSSYNQPLEIMGQRANIPGRQTFHSCKDRLRLVTYSSTLEWVLGKHGKSAFQCTLMVLILFKFSITRGSSSEPGRHSQRAIWLVKRVSLVC